MISVCMATYNGELYIRQQLDSILLCLGERDELVVSDDGSTDATIEIVKSYVFKDRRVKLVNGPHRGVVANFSSLISLAKGDLIFLADQDDIWRADKVSTVKAAFETEGATLVTHNARIVDSEGVPNGDSLFNLRGSRAGLLKNIVKNSYVGCCMAFKSGLVNSILPIPDNVEMHDWWIGLVGEMVSRPVFIDDELIDYRRHSANVSQMHHHPLPRMVANRGVLVAEMARRRLRDSGCAA